MGPAPNPNASGRTALVSAGLALFCVVAYLPSFRVDFFLDDFRIILENPALQDPGDLAAIWNFSPARFFASLTFALNYALHGERIFGYHLANLAIHLGAGAAVLALAKGLVRARARGRALTAGERWLPWIAAAVFLLHPLQTQAVTYIVQRYTSLMAMLYLAALASYVWARIGRRRLLYAATAAFAILALASKQSAATLPAALLTVELVVLRNLGVRPWLAVLAAGLLGVAGLAALVNLPSLDALGVTRETLEISRIDYLATQVEVLWRYLGLLFLVGEQRLEYDLVPADGFSDSMTILLALAHVALIATAAALWRRAPLLTFGVALYYLAHFVESGFLPISDLAFEHRTYLPNAGAALVAALAISALIDRQRRLGGAILVLLVFAMTAATYARNLEWTDRIGFLEREARLSPTDQRAWTSLGKELMRDGRFRDALDALQQAREIAIEHEDGRLRTPTLLNLIFALHYTGQDRAAIELADSAPVEEFSATERAFYYEAQGRAFLGLGRFDAAREALLEAARINPTANVVAHLAQAELGLGRRERARELAEQVLALVPGHAVARNVLRAVDGS